jgi:hypothetical protein
MDRWTNLEIQLHYTRVLHDLRPQLYHSRISKPKKSPGVDICDFPESLVAELTQDSHQEGEKIPCSPFNQLTDVKKSRQAE